MNRKILILFICSIISSFSNGQNIQLNLSFFPDSKKINAKIKSTSNLKISADLEYTNEKWKQVSKNKLSDNKLYVVIYENNKLLDNSVAHKDIKPSEPPSYYEKEMKLAEERQNQKIKIPSMRSINLQYNILIYPTVESVFKEHPCEIFNCWYEFYTLQKGKKYTMELRLKVKSKVYKSNKVEFIY